jgi:hypothetical protein
MSGAWFVLVGGEAKETHGGAIRELQHASLSHVGRAYEKLRQSGVPRSRIITVVQLADFLSHSEPGSWMKSYYESICELLIKEGGADYDFDLVNPATIGSVLLGEGDGKVVPKDASAVLFAMYSHGDSYGVFDKSTTQGGANSSASGDMSINYMDPAIVPKGLDPQTNEWYAHMPYPCPQHQVSELYSFVATQNGKNPHCYLYATQLKQIFARMFHDSPSRTVVGLLNYCRSGGALNFMRDESEAVRAFYGSDKWPLFLMSASQPSHDALVGGLWEAFFDCFTAAIGSIDTCDLDNSLCSVYRRAKHKYLEDNRYQLKDLVATFAYASNFGEDDDTYSEDLFRLICAGPEGTPDFEALQALQQDYREGGTRGEGTTRQIKRSRKKKKILLWHPQHWGGPEVDLVEAVRKAQAVMAAPEVVFGGESQVDQLQVAAAFGRSGTLTMAAAL